MFAGIGQEYRRVVEDQSQSATLAAASSSLTSPLPPLPMPPLPGQEYRRIIGEQNQSATLAASSSSSSSLTSPLQSMTTTSAMTSNVFVAPPRRDENDIQERCDTPPAEKRAKLYTENEWMRNWMFKREINFAKHPIRILGRRYALTKTSYKYVDIAIVVKRQSYVDIALGDCHGKEISLTADMWKDLLALRNDILRYFENDSEDHRVPTYTLIGTTTIRYGKINNLKTLRFESGKNRISMSQATVKALFDLDLCVNRVVATLTNALEIVDCKLSSFIDIATQIDHPNEIPEGIRQHENFDANDLIDCELHALLFSPYYSL